MEQRKQLNFEGQTIYCGIDVHKKSWKVNLRLKEMDLKTFSQNPSWQDLQNHMMLNYPKAKYQIVYEAGFSGFSTQRSLQKNDFNCIVVNPADIPTMDKDKKRKSDTVDCRKLSKCLSEGSITGIYIPSIEQQDDRGIVRVYQQIVRDQTRGKNRIKSWLDFQGINTPNDDKKHWSNNFIQWLKQIPLSESARVHLDILIDSYLQTRQLVLSTTKKLRELSNQERYRNDIRLLRSIPGVGPITAILYITEIGDINRFKGLDQLADYVGLVPQTHSSGEKEFVKGLSYRGNQALREALIEASWVAVRVDPALTMAFTDYAKRMKKNKAIIKIGRKMLNRIRFVLKNKQECVTAVIK